MKKLSKENQIKFYQEEIKKIIDDYKSYLDSKCIDLINKVELFMATLNTLILIEIKSFSLLIRINYQKQKFHLQHLSQFLQIF
jgi:hypothetical protein